MFAGIVSLQQFEIDELSGHPIYGRQDIVSGDPFKHSTILFIDHLSVIILSVDVQALS